MSDHPAIHCTLRPEKPPNVRLKTTSRSYKHVCVAAICEDIRSLRLSVSLSDDVDYAVDTYNTGLTAIIDKHAPIKICTVIVRPHTPWHNNDIRSQSKSKTTAGTQMEEVWHVE